MFPFALSLSKGLQASTKLSPNGVMNCGNVNANLSVGKYHGSRCFWKKAATRPYNAGSSARLKPGGWASKR